MALCPGLPGWASTKKEKPIWILLKQETVRGDGISWAICKPAPCSRQIPHQLLTTQFFTGWMPFLPPNQQRQSTEGLRAHHSALQKWLNQSRCHLGQLVAQGTVYSVEVHIDATWQIWWNYLSTVAIQPYVKLLWPFAIQWYDLVHPVAMHANIACMHSVVTDLVVMPQTF